MITRIVSFDFDGTLIHTPSPLTGIDEWEKKTGYPWQGRGWWANAESLNLKVFYPGLNDWVHRLYEKYSNDQSSYCFVATGRLKKLESHVQKILHLHDIDCDLFCNTGGDTLRFKIRLFENMILNNPKAEELIMFDDREEHIVKFEEWAESQSIKITIVDVIKKVTRKINH